jgi:hypothetical protein
LAYKREREREREMIVNIDGAKRIEIAWAFFQRGEKFLIIFPKKTLRKL